jgi:opacity protein-like surface antigen
LHTACFIALYAGALMVLSAAPARAQGFISPTIGWDFGEDSKCPEIDECKDKNLNVGVGVGTMGNVFGFELEFGYAKDFFGSGPGFDSSMLTLMGNVMLIPNLGPFRPYALTGFGLIKSHVELTPESVFSNDENHFGWDVGGGLMILFGDHVGVRGDLRYFHSFKDLELLDIDLGGAKLDWGRASGGLVFKF